MAEGLARKLQIPRPKLQRNTNEQIPMVMGTGTFNRQWTLMGANSNGVFLTSFQHAQWELVGTSGNWRMAASFQSSVFSFQPGA
jgi:hypothetical protein